MTFRCVSLHLQVYYLKTGPYLHPKCNFVYCPENWEIYKQLSDHCNTVVNDKLQSLTCILMKLFEVKLSEMLATIARDCLAAPIIIWTYLNHIYMNYVTTSQRIHASYRFTMIYHRKNTHMQINIPYIRILFGCMNQPSLCSKNPGNFLIPQKNGCPKKIEGPETVDVKPEKGGFQAPRCQSVNTDGRGKGLSLGSRANHLVKL